jgi:CRP/FNR family transcriptional regulator, cyclic AMP receptor protein
VSLTRYVKNQAPVMFPAGTTLFEQGDPGNVMYVVESGEVELSYGDTSLRVGPETSFGEMALIDKRPRSATAKAVTDVSAYAISQGLFLVLIQETPYFALEVMQSLSDRIRRANGERIES